MIRKAGHHPVNQIFERTCTNTPHVRERCRFKGREKEPTPEMTLTGRIWWNYHKERKENGEWRRIQKSKGINLEMTVRCVTTERQSERNEEGFREGDYENREDDSDAGRTGEMNKKKVRKPALEQERRQTKAREKIQDAEPTTSDADRPQAKGMDKTSECVPKEEVKRPERGGRKGRLVLN